MSQKNSSFPSNVLPYALLFVAGAAGYFISKWAFPGGADHTMAGLQAAVGWGGALMVGLLGLAVVYRMFDGTINLTQLVSEPSGDASMSRFQLLVFTFVIAISFILIAVSSQPVAFPNIPPTVLALLGISAGSYVVSKGIQKDITIAQMTPSITLSPDSITAVPGQSVTISASATGAGDLTYQWQSLSPGQTTAVDLTGEQAPSLRLTPKLEDNGTEYLCQVSSSKSGEATSAPVKLTVQPDRG
jgi:hypothetical protein